MDEFRDFKTIFDEVNACSNFKNSTEKIIEDAVNELNMVKKQFLPEYHSEEIQKVLFKAENRMNEKRQQFMNLLSNEVAKDVQKIPQQLKPGTVGAVEFQLIQHRVNIMEPEEILQYAAANRRDDVILTICKSEIITRCRGMEDKEQAKNLKLAARSLQLETRETIIADYNRQLNSISMDNLFPGCQFGKSVSLSEKTLEGEILARANIDKVSKIRHRGVNEQIGDVPNEVQQEQQFR